MGKIEGVDAAENAEQLRVVAGRRAPFTQCPDWVLLAPISRGAKFVYWVLKAHVNMERAKNGDTEVWPTQDMIAEIAELSEGRKIRPYVKELVAIEAVRVRKIRRANGMRQLSIYTVHEMPPEGYGGLTSLQDFYAARRKRILAAQQEQPDAAEQAESDVA